MKDALSRNGISGKFINTYEKNEYEIHIHDQVDIGLKQGDHQSPAFFLTFIEPFLRKLPAESIGVVVGETKVNVLAYADNIVVIASTPSYMQTQLDILNNWCQQNLLDINITKTNIMIICNHSTHNYDWNLGDNQIGIVDEKVCCWTET